MCEYEFRNGRRCVERATRGSSYCILHVDIPNEINSPEYQRIVDLKEGKTERKIQNRDFNFEGARLVQISIALENEQIDADVNFDNAKIKRDATLSALTIQGNVIFDGAEIGEDLNFMRLKISGDIKLSRNARIGGNLIFKMAEVEGNIYFQNSLISGWIDFEGAKIHGNVFGDKSEIGGGSFLPAANIDGALSFRGTKFKHPITQQIACMAAKAILEKYGDRGGADLHFYREMQARRKQKDPLRRYIMELPIEIVFGYGVKPKRLLSSWFLMMAIFALIYWFGGLIQGATGIGDDLSFSITTAMTPVIGGYLPQPGIGQLATKIEAILGTIFWLSLVATFARKYMR
jgi:hypothetical protein